MNEHYGAKAGEQSADVDWIAEAAQRGEVMISKDTALAYSPEEAKAIYMNKARIFAFSNKSLLAMQMTDLLLRWQDAIWRTALRAEGPYVYAISNNAPRRCRLRYPW